MNVFLMCFDSASLEQLSCARDNNKLHGKPKGHGYLGTDNSGLLLPGTPWCCCKGTFPYLVGSGNEKKKGLGGQWWWETAAAQRLCSPGRVESGAWQSRGSFPTILAALLGCTSHAWGCSLGARLFTFCPYWPFCMDWASLFLCRGSKIPCTGPGGRSSRISPTITDSEYPQHGAEQVLISCPLLGCSPCCLPLLFHKHPPAVAFSLPCVWIFLFTHLFIPKSQQNKGELFQAHVQKRHHLPSLPTTPLFPSFVV